ncbi:hypothetical protein D3C86_1769670 [compost metagenome]
MRVVTIAVDGEKKQPFAGFYMFRCSQGSEGLRPPKILGETVAPRKVEEEGESNGNFLRPTYLPGCGVGSFHSCSPPVNGRGGEFRSWPNVF